MSPPQLQIAVRQTQVTRPANSVRLPLTIDRSAPIPELATEHHVLIRVLAVALNPNDHKMITHFNIPGGGVGCDFCGVIADARNDGSEYSKKLPVGARVCGALFPYNPENPHNGSFAQYCSADSRLLVRVPDSWSDLEAASLGVGWSTLCLTLSDPNALALEGTPTNPTHVNNDPVLVYGGATASGTLACQLLKL